MASPLTRREIPHSDHRSGVRSGRHRALTTARHGARPVQADLYDLADPPTRDLAHGAAAAAPSLSAGWAAFSISNRMRVAPHRGCSLRSSATATSVAELTCRGHDRGRCGQSTSPPRPCSRYEASHEWTDCRDTPAARATSATGGPGEHRPHRVQPLLHDRQDHQRHPGTLARSHPTRRSRARARYGQCQGSVGTTLSSITRHTPSGVVTYCRFWL